MRLHLNVLSAYSCLYIQGTLVVILGDHLKFQGLNPGHPHARQEPYMFY